MKPLTALVPILLALAACGGRTASSPPAPAAEPIPARVPAPVPATAPARVAVVAPTPAAVPVPATPAPAIATPAPGPVVVVEPEPVAETTADGMDAAPAAPAAGANLDENVGDAFVPITVVEAPDPGVTALAFSLFGGRATWGHSGCVVSGVETVWIGDDVPADASVTGENGDTWAWVSADPAPKVGTRSHQSAVAEGGHQQICMVPGGLPLKPGSSLFAWVHLDPANPPQQVMLQWNRRGDWNHRAYWGENRLGWPGTAMGPLPALGTWVRLEVSMDAVHLR